MSSKYTDQQRPIDEGMPMERFNSGDYYLLKAFSNQTYQDQFNSGAKIYINPVEYFHNNGDGFQRDSEGVVFQQSAGLRGMLIFSKDKKSLDARIKEYKSNQFSPADIVIPTTSFKFYLQGHICCFALFPKRLIQFRENTIVFAQGTEAEQDFYAFLNGYSESQGYSFFSFYDAQVFLTLFERGMLQKGYSICYGPVQYRPLDIRERIRMYQDGNIQEIIFTKDASFSYQKEFRVFVQSEEPKKGPIIESGIDLRDSVVFGGAYLNIDYIKANNIIIP